MAFDINSIKSARQNRPRRILGVGGPKDGKSALACQSPSLICIPVKGEEGIDELDVQTFPTIQKFSDLLEAIGTLYVEDHPYKTLIIDSVSTLEPIVWDETRRINGGVDSIEKVGGGYAKGYIEALKQWRELTEGLDALRNDRGVASILIGHTKVEKYNDPNCEPYDRYSLDIHKHAGSLLTRWCDGILFVSRKPPVIKKDDVGFGNAQNRPVDISGGIPYMYTQVRPAHPGGGRGAWGKLPYEMPLNWSALEGALAKHEIDIPSQNNNNSQEGVSNG